MPQLIPAPWFATLIFSWLILLAILMPKVLIRRTPNEPALRNPTPLKTNPWNWPWPQTPSTSL